MRFELKDYQAVASTEVLKALRRATRDLAEDPTELHAISLSAPTVAGKTVIAAAVIEALLQGAGSFAPDPEAVVLWVTDDPALNEQTKRKIIAASNLPLGCLVTIDAGFDQRAFRPGAAYFLNIQKLARTNPLAKGNTNARTYSLWQSIANTIQERGGHFYVIIDEAHRGMRHEGDRETIVSRIINGQSGANPPAPVVWGISATPQRFQRATAHRSSRSIAVSIADVRASGLLKDAIVLDSPTVAQPLADTTLVRAAAARTREFETAWATYTERQGEPPVLPALVVQVRNAPSEAELAELLDAVHGAWPGLHDRNIVNTFGDHATLSVGRHTIRYMAPQEIQDDPDIRVVLCKDAISTGWDCPRAEVLVSLRRAIDATYITQLIGRMVRTPLARRVPTDRVLNTVSVYLPHFNQQQVASIVERFDTGQNDEPPVPLVTDAVRVRRNPDIPPHVFSLLEDLPTYVVPGTIYRSQVSRLFTFAALLVGDNILDDAIGQARLHLVAALDAHRARLEADGSLPAAVRRIRGLRIERTYALLAAETIDHLPALDEDAEVPLDPNNVDDLFRVAKRKLPEGVAIAYLDRVLEAQGTDLDTLEAKVIVAALALHPEVAEAVDAAAEALVRVWLRTHQKSIAQLPDAHKARYETIRRETRSAEPTNLIVPESDVLAGAGQRWPKHVLCADDATFPQDLKGWEAAVLRAELADDDLVAWYRNPTGGEGALRLSYAGERREAPMYPDFILFHWTDDGIRPSIVDPHGYHLADAAPKLRGLARYADRHGDDYLRIDAVIKDTDERLLALDLKSAAIRDAIEGAAELDVLGLFLQYGHLYS